MDMPHSNLKTLNKEKKLNFAFLIQITTKRSFGAVQITAWTVGYNEFDFFLENKEYRPFDGCKIEI